jgi:hypothetical protein
MEEDATSADERAPADGAPNIADPGPGSVGSTRSPEANPGRLNQTWSERLGDQRVWLMWLAAGGVMLGVLGCGILLLLVLNPSVAANPTATAAVARATAVPAVTLTPSGTPTVAVSPTKTATVTPTPTASATPTPTPDVILLGVKALGELNTVEYSLKTVVEKEAQQSGPLLLRPGLHFLMVAQGHVKAGVDFAEMVRYDIVGDQVTVYLPAPRITEYAVDPDSLETYYIHTGFGLDEKFAIEKYNEALGEAQESLRLAALETDILDAAQANARALVQSLVLGLGFSEVDVVFVPSGTETEMLEGPLELPITPAPFVTATPGG